MNFKRHNKLELFIPVSKNIISLFALLQRRIDLKQMLVDKENHTKTPGAKSIKTSYQEVIKILNKQVELIDEKIQNLFDEDPALKAQNHCYC